MPHSSARPRLDWPILLVAPDQLGVLSHVLTAIESAQRRGLVVAAVVLAQLARHPGDSSTRTNALILEERLMRPILRFQHSRDDDDDRGRKRRGGNRHD